MPLRIQQNFLAAPERRLLDLLCARMPAWATPDGLTMLGLCGAGLVFAGYALSRAVPAMLWLSIPGYLLHWFGDSLDGSLARHRGIERPRYGYFLDHSVDALGNFFIMAGLGLTAAVRMDVALFALLGYFMLSIYVFLKRQVMDRFELSFLALGPTELRIALIALTVSMPWLGAIHFALAGVMFSVCDGVVLLGGIIFIALFVWNVARTADELRRQGE